MLKGDTIVIYSYDRYFCEGFQMLLATQEQDDIFSDNNVLFRTDFLE